MRHFYIIVALATRISLVAILCLSIVDCSLLPLIRPRAPERKGKLSYSKEYIEKSKAMMESFKIPNRNFCSEMILMPEDQYLVLPWWYNYCQDLKEKNAKGLNGNMHYTAIHKYILDEVQAFKKRQKIKSAKLLELQKQMA